MSRTAGDGPTSAGASTPGGGDPDAAEFEQVSFLAGETLSVVYAGDEWVPEAHLAHAEGEGSARETFLTELRLLGRELARSPTALRRLVRASRTMTTKQLVIAVIVVKKLVIVALVAWLVL